jgi:predicted DNA-binding transcriptional regulator YafY
LKKPQGENGMPKKLNPEYNAADRTLLFYSKLLFSGRRQYLAELINEYGCSKATIMRMMNTIERSGVAEILTDIEDGRRWYQLKHLPATPHIGLTENEVEKLALCRDMLERLLPEGIERVITAGIEKVSALMRQADKRGEVTAPKAARSSFGRIDYSAHQEKMETLLAAVSARRVCNIVYREPEYRYDDREPKAYSFVPTRLTVEDESINAEGWRVTGRGRVEAQSPLTVAIQRLDSCSATNRILAPCPPLPEQRGAFGLVGYSIFPARIHFCEEFGGYIRERSWSEGQEITDLPDGGVELRFTAADEDELMGWVFSFGNGAELLEPEHLRRRMEERCAEIQELCTDHVKHANNNRHNFACNSSRGDTLYSDDGREGFSSICFYLR